MLVAPEKVCTPESVSEPPPVLSSAPLPLTTPLCVAEPNAIVSVVGSFGALVEWAVLLMSPLL